MDAETEVAGHYKHQESNISIVKTVRGTASYLINQLPSKSKLKLRFRRDLLPLHNSLGEFSEQSNLYVQEKSDLLSQGVLKVFISCIKPSCCAWSLQTISARSCCQERRVFFKGHESSLQDMNLLYRSFWQECWASCQPRKMGSTSSLKWARRNCGWWERETQNASSFRTAAKKLWNMLVFF